MFFLAYPLFIFAIIHILLAFLQEKNIINYIIHSEVFGLDTSKIIKERRIELGLTLKDVAEALGVAESTVSRYETKEINNMGIDKIEALSRVLKCSPGYLMGWESKPSKDEPIEINTIAAHALRDLTDEEQEKIIEFAKFIKSQRKSSNDENK